MPSVSEDASTTTAAVLLVLCYLSISTAAGATLTPGFVEEVACGSRSMTIVLNKTDPDITKWMKDPKAKPVVYVHGYKERTPCGLFIKPPDNLSMFLNFTIPYGPACSVYLSDLEPNYQVAETSVVIEDHAEFNSYKPLRINHVFCVYTKQVETVRFKDVSNSHQIVASTGSKPKPKVRMLFRDASGNPLKAARFGDPVGLYLMLDPDNAYKAINPKHCIFSDREQMEEPEAKTLTFVQSDCPVPEIAEIIAPVQDVNEEIYFTEFQAFRFGGKSTVYAHCKVEVCLDPTSCNKCFAKVENSSTTAEKLRRLRRSARSASQPREAPAVATRSPQETQQVDVSNVLTVLDEQQSKEVTKEKSPLYGSERLYQELLIAIGFLGALTLFTTIAVLFLIGKFLRMKRMCSKITIASQGVIHTLSPCSIAAEPTRQVEQCSMPCYYNQNAPLSQLTDNRGTDLTPRSNHSGTCVEKTSL